MLPAIPPSVKFVVSTDGAVPLDQFDAPRFIEEGVAFLANFLRSARLKALIFYQQRIGTDHNV